MAQKQKREMTYPNAGGKKAGNGAANQGFEQKLWQAADKLRGKMDASEYKHGILGLIFLITMEMLHELRVL